MPEEEEEGARTESAPGRSVLQLIWIYHPLAFLALALAIAGVSYSLLPKQAREEPKPLSWFYKRSLENLRKAKNPLVDATDDSVRESVQIAMTDLDFVFRHPSYRNQVENDPNLLNPFMLFGESLFLYGQHPDITQDRVKTFQLSSWAFSEAQRWEDKYWDEREQRIYDRQYFEPGEVFDERVLAERKLLRMQYLQYMRAISALKAGQYNLAGEGIQELMRQFRLEGLGQEEDGQKPRSLVNLPPHEFELLPEEKVLLYFYSGQLNEQRGNIAEAARDYQVFLLHARRSREYFQALMRLGSFYFAEAEGSSGSDNERARRLYGEAAEIFSKVVAASPPGDILREAYFMGGRAYLNIAAGMSVGEKTLWNKAEDLGEKAEERLVILGRGKELPPRTKVIVPALARIMAQDGVARIFPAEAVSTLLPATGLGLATKERLTPLGERREYLRRAKAFFTGAQGGDGLFDGAAYVMLSKTYMIEGDFDKARGLLRYTRSKFWSKDVERACDLGVAVSYLLEGNLDKALVRFTGGVEKNEPSLLVEYDILSWTELCRSIYENSRKEGNNPGKRIWGMLPDNVQEIVRNAATTDRLPERFNPILLRRLNDILSREDFYDAESFKGMKDLPETVEILLREEIPLLTMQNRQWLNRMLLDSYMRSSVILPTNPGEIIRPFPGAAEITSADSYNPVLLNPRDIIVYLKDLARLYVEDANRKEADNANFFRLNRDVPENELRLLWAAPRRDLENASRVNRYLIGEYPPPDIGEVMLDNASILRRRANLAASAPFFNHELARRLISEAAEAYMEIGMSGQHLEIEAEALLEAGRNFYAAARYGRAGEALTRYVQNYSEYPEIGWARNLLGRCYWYQGRFREAISVYRTNSERLTPDGRDSMYYLGAVFLDARTAIVDKTEVDLIGNPEMPFAREREGGGFMPETALQVFNEIRRMPGITPSSRPWRWATFGLGRTWYEIAERTRLAEEARALAENREPASIVWLPLYETAEQVLREGLERYRLQYGTVDDNVGVSREREPEDYFDIMRQRMESEYFLAMTQKVIARGRVEGEEEEMRQHFSNVINQELYPKNMADLDTARLLLSNRSVLGVNEGPVVRPLYLDTLRHNSYFFLAQSWKDYGRKLRQENKPQPANAAYERALQVYRTARDQLSLLDGPRILYNIGEVMIALDRAEDARRLFLMAITQVKQLEAAGQNPDSVAELTIWRQLSEDRLRDLEKKVNP